jgi:hypothetical protein
MTEKEMERLAIDRPAIDRLATLGYTSVHGPVLAPDGDRPVRGS